MCETGTSGKPMYIIMCLLGFMLTSSYGYRCIESVFDHKSQMGNDLRMELVVLFSIADY